jgi:DNA-binding transcriptional LysR family regulator
MEWDEVRYFLAVARSRSLIAAARSLKVSAATVARRIDALEKRLGARLFERRQTGCVLTDSGEGICAEAEAAEESILALERKALGRDLSVSGKVRIAATDDIAAHVIAPHFSEFRAFYPDIELEIVAQMDVLNLTRREADIAVRSAKPESGDLIARRIGSWGYGLYASRSYVEAHNLRSGLTGLSQVEVITWTEEWARLRGGPWLREHAPKAKIILASDSRRVHQNACKAGIGVAVLPCRIADLEDELVCLLSPEKVLSLDLWLVVHGDLARIARIRAVADFLAKDVGRAAPLNH